MSETGDLLIRGGAVVSVDPGIGTLLGGDVLIRDGRIAEVGHVTGVRDVETVDASRMIVMPGLVETHGPLEVTESEIVAFASSFDPHDMHVDPEAARRSPFGGLIASGWHTTALMMRLMVGGFLNQRASVASPGVDELRWLLPVRPGDLLRMPVRVQRTRGPVWRFEGKAYIGEDLCAEAEYSAMISERGAGGVSGTSA